MKGCRPLHDDEVRRVVESFRGPLAIRNRALFVLGTKSGFRISELLSLRVGDVIQHGKLVERIRVERRYMKKKKEGRTVLLHPGAAAILKDWIIEARRRGHGTRESFLFQSSAGGNRALSRSGAWRVLNRVFARIGLTGTLGTHCMRKTFANKVYDALEHDLRKTQAALGHRNVDSTARYLSFREEDIDEAIRST